MSSCKILSPLARSVFSSKSICLQSTPFVLRYRVPPLRKVHTMPDNPIFQAISKHDPKSIAIVHSESGRTFTYGSLLHEWGVGKDLLLHTEKGKPLGGERIAFLAENGYDYVGARWMAYS